METERNKVLENHSDTQDSANEESEDESLGSEEDEGMSDNEVASDDKSSDNEHPQQATGLDDQTDCDTNVDKKLESLQLGSSDNEEISQEACGSSDGKIRNSSKLLDGHELVDLFRSVYSGHRVHEEYLTVGFVCLQCLLSMHYNTSTCKTLPCRWAILMWAKVQPSMPSYRPRRYQCQLLQDTPSTSRPST